MSERNIQEKVQGKLEALGGRIKRTFGSILHHEQREAEGRAQELAGQSKAERAEGRERGEGAVKQGAGSLKREMGEVFRDEKVEAQGRAQEIEGRVQRERNQ
jgi:uncharacterized protein YjbJ (UPF0337 family)